MNKVHELKTIIHVQIDGTRLMVQTYLTMTNERNEYVEYSFVFM